MKEFILFFAKFFIWSFVLFVYWVFASALHSAILQVRGLENDKSLKIGFKLFEFGFTISVIILFLYLIIF